MTDFVLVHGSWFGGWCWDEVASRLRAGGHRVCAEDLPGHGQDMTAVAACTLDAYVEQVCATVDSLPGPVVLVGHSMGGVVISGVAERQPGRIAKLVYVAAYLLREGESIQSISEWAPHSPVRSHMAPAADWSSVAFRDEGLADTFLSDCAEDLVRRAAALNRPEPTAVFHTPTRVTAERFGAVPRTYIRTLGDRALSPALQDRMLAATPCAPVLDIGTAHCPMLAAPDELAALLQGARSADARSVNRQRHGVR